MRKTLLTITALALLVVGGSFATSQTAQAVTLIPPSVESAVDPGEPLVTEIKLYNETQDTVELYPEVRPFIPDGETGTPLYQFDEETVAGAAETWFTLPEGPIVLEGGERETIDITITPPTDAAPGGHYVGLLWGTEPPNADEGGQVALSAKVATLFLLRVFGDVNESGAIAQFTVTGDGTNRLPVEFATRYQNDGNIHLRPTGTLRITNTFGSESAVLEVNPNSGAVLPDSIRKYTTVWEREQVEEGGFWAEYNNEIRNFALGRYTATVTMTAGGGDLLRDSATLTFWIWPWRVLLVWGLIVVALLVLIVFGVKRYNRMIIEKAKGASSKPESKE